MKTLFTSAELKIAEAIGKLNYVNPFMPERMLQEQIVLGRKDCQRLPVWHSLDGSGIVNNNVLKIWDVCNGLVEKLASRIPTLKAPLSGEELRIYDSLIIYWLFEKYRPAMTDVIFGSTEKIQFTCYKQYHDDFHHFIEAIPRESPSAFQPERVFAIFHQIHRAFYYIYDFIAGGSLAAADLRSAIWQSIFTHDIYRYHRFLYDKMETISTLVTGESGTGKELVARAIALSRYIPFSAKTNSFAQGYRDSFKAIQLSAMSQNLIESELFGHVKGAYTGAVSDHAGYLESCTAHDSIFLDEIGDVSMDMQIKLLRVLQSRTFQRLGDTKTLEFHAKIIAATNQNLLKGCQNGSFRQDLYYRLCSDVITTVPLRKLLDGNKHELKQFISVLANRFLDKNSEVPAFSEDASNWIENNIGLNYPWPGNVRELTQCLRNLLIRGSYTPQTQATASTENFNDANFRRLFFSSTRLSATELMKEYIQAVYQREGNIARTATAVGLDRRTVQKYL